MTILIHKGDDTIFGPQEKFITFIFETELDLTGWKAQFKLGGFTKVIEDISSKQFDITISHSTTVQLPLGELNGSVVLIDNNNRIKTIINTIPFVVTKDVIEQQYETIDLTIPKSSGVDIKMRIGGRAVYSINGKTGEVVLTAEDIGAIPTESLSTLATHEYVDTSIANTQAELDATNARLNQKASIDYVDEELDLKADKTEVARKANISDIPTRVSQLVNDEGYLTEHQDISGKADIDYVDEALGYKADKSDTYTKVEVDTIIDELTLESSAVTSVNGMVGDVVVDVPDVSVFATKGQLITGLSTKQDKGDYVLKEELPSFDDYVKNTDYATSTKHGVISPDTSFGTAVNSNGKIYIVKAGTTAIEAKKSLYNPITPSDLDHAVKTGVTTNTIELTEDEQASARTWLNAVGKEDYASSEKAGIAKINLAYGININNQALTILKASDNEVKGKGNLYRPIVPANLDLAVKTGVTTNTIQLTEDEKASAKAWLGYAEPTDILQAIASIPQFKMVIVDTLPEAGEKMTLYFVPKEGTEGDIYNEYVWIDETQVYEFLGSTAVDLTDYVKNTDYANSSTGGVVRVQNGSHGLMVSSYGILTIYKATEAQITGKSSDHAPLVTKNIDLVVKTGVTTNTIELTDDEKASARTWLGAVGDTDYASNDKAGIVKASTVYGLNVGSTGNLFCSEITLNSYLKQPTNFFIAKGTLDNVLTQYATNEKIGEVEDLLDEINGGTSILTTKTVVTTEADYNALATKDPNTLYLIEE